MSKNKTKIVIDTNVIISGLRSTNGASYLLLNELEKQNYKSCVSTAVILEYEAIMLRVLKFPTWAVSDFLDYIVKTSELVPISYRWRPFLSDPKDECFLELAVVASSQYIITYNKKDFKDVYRYFGIKIYTPMEFLNEMEYKETKK